MCWSVENGCWPIHGTPSPPIWVKPTVARSIQIVMKWQPMPAMAREPSGTLVLVLCGQPEQNQGWRSAPASGEFAPWLSSVCIDCSCALRIASCVSMRAITSSGTPSFFSRLAMARAMMAGDKSALARSRWCALGLGMDHSPPALSPAPSSNLPNTVGRTSLRQLYSSSLIWYSMTWRFSSTTRISRRPVANSRVVCASSGQTTATLCNRRPMR